MMTGAPIPNEQRAFESVFPWQGGWQTLKAIWPQLVYTSLVTVSIPQYLLYWFQSQKAWKLGPNFNFNPSFSLLESIGWLEEFAVSYIGGALGVFLISLLGYLSVVAMVIQIKQGYAPQIAPALKAALSALLPRGLVLLLSSLLGFLFLMQFMLQLPGAALFLELLFLLGAVLIAGLPILLMLNPKKPWSALRQAIRMSYTENTSVSRWSAFFVILSFEMLLMGSSALLDFGKRKLVFLDMSLSIPREIWMQQTAFFPFGVVPMLLEGLRFLLEGFLILGFAVFSAHFILSLTYKGSRGQQIDIAA